MYVCLFDSTAQGQWHQPDEVTLLIAQGDEEKTRGDDIIDNNEKVTDIVMSMDSVHCIECSS